VEGPMSGTVAMVTGGNAGMGKEIVQALARMGGTVVMVSRDRARGEFAQAEAQQKTRAGQVELLVADLSSQQSIRKLVRDFEASHCLLYTSPSPRDLSTSRMPSSA